MLTFVWPDHRLMLLFTYFGQKCYSTTSKGLTDIIIEITIPEQHLCVMSILGQMPIISVFLCNSFHDRIVMIIKYDDIL